MGLLEVSNSKYISQQGGYSASTCMQQEHLGWNDHQLWLLVKGDSKFKPMHIDHIIFLADPSSQVCTHASFKCHNIKPTKRALTQATNIQQYFSCWLTTTISLPRKQKEKKIDLNHTSSTALSTSSAIAANNEKFCQ